MDHSRFSQAYQKHLQEEHKASTISSYLKEIVYGGIDGIITTFAVVSSFTGATGSGTALYPMIVVLLFGLANLFGDATSMGLANFLSTRSEHKLYKKELKKELHEITHNPEFEKEESMEILVNKGMSKEDAKQFVDLYSKYPQYWAEFMMQYEVKLPTPENESSAKNAIATFSSFIFFGFIPLIPYVFGIEINNLFLLSTGFSAAALILLGILRGRITIEPLWLSITETVALGSIAAVIAYIVGTFFA